MDKVYVVSLVTPQSEYTEPDYWAEAQDAEEIMGVFGTDYKANEFAATQTRNLLMQHAISADEISERVGKKVHYGSIYVDPEDAEIINDGFAEAPENEDECWDEDEIMSYTAKFGKRSSVDGYSVCVRVRGHKYEEGAGEGNLPWAEAVLLKDGVEVDHTKPDNRFFGSWQMSTLDGHVFVVNVIEDDANSQWFKVSPWVVQ